MIPQIAAAGANHFGILSPAASDGAAYAQSVINGSNVHNASVTNTASNATSSDTQNLTMATSSVGSSSAAVPRTPAMMTGIVIGYNSTGNSTSRLRARTSIAAKSVPTAQYPS